MSVKAGTGGIQVQAETLPLRMLKKGFHSSDYIGLKSMLNIVLVFYKPMVLVGF